MFVVGALLMLSSAATGSLLAWQNGAVVHLRVGPWLWTAHLGGVLIVGALLACWFLLGAAFIRCRIAERRRMRAARQAAGGPQMPMPAADAAPPRPLAGAGLTR